LAYNINNFVEAGSHEALAYGSSPLTILQECTKESHEALAYG